MSNFRQPVCLLYGLGPDAVAFDPVTRLVYGNQFWIFAGNGQKYRDYSFGGGGARCLLAHPQGGKVLGLVNGKLYLFETPTK